MGWDMGLTLAWTVPVTGIAQLAFTWFSAAPRGVPLHACGWPRMTPDLKRLAIIAGPAVLAGGVVQINLLVGRQVACFTEGRGGLAVLCRPAVPAAAWASSASPSAPSCCPTCRAACARATLQGGRDSFNRGTEFALALTVPAAVALVVIALPLTTVLFQRGAFGADDAADTALALAAYGAGPARLRAAQGAATAVLRARGHAQPVPLCRRSRWW